MAECNDTNADDVFGKEFQSDEELAGVYMFWGYSEALLQFASACCVIFMLIGIPGNLITIVALARCKKVRNATAIFIINLHTSDLLFNSFILPMTAISFVKGNWTHGWVMCRVYAYLKYVFNSSAIFTVLAISINRYVIVCHPLLYPKLYKTRNISISILMIWASAFALFLASYFGAWGRFDLEPNGGFCTMMRDRNCKSPKQFLLTLGFAGPSFIIVLCYAQIWWVVQTAKKNQSTKPARPTHLPLSKTQTDISSYGTELVSFDTSSPVSSTVESISTLATDSDKTPTSSAATTPRSPNEEKSYEKYFKAPFRLTRKLVSQKVPTRRDKKLCAMIAAIMISFCISHLPVMAAKFSYKDYKSEPIVNILSHLVEYLGKCINPIIYVLMSKEYRQAYQSLFEAIIQKYQALKLRISP